jgi:thiol-disulfide isomerase/thioredoxin
VCNAAIAGPEVGGPAPTISVDTWIVERDAAAAQPAATLLKFWGTWCGPCVMEMPAVQRLADMYQPFGLEVIAVSYESQDVIREYVDRTGYSLHFGADPDRSMIDAYGVASWPSSYLLDAEGMLRYTGDGSNQLRDTLHESLGLPIGPEGLLSEIMAIAGQGAQSKDPARIQELRSRLGALARVAASASAEPFDLGAWAQSQLDTDGTELGDAEPARVHLNRCLQARSAGDQETYIRHIAHLASNGEDAFNLGDWMDELAPAIDPLGAMDALRMMADRQLFSFVDQSYRIDENSFVRDPDGRVQRWRATRSVNDNEEVRAIIAGLVPVLESRAAQGLKIEQRFLDPQIAVRDGGLILGGVELDETGRIHSYLVHGTWLTPTNIDRVLRRWLIAVSFARAVASEQDPSISEIKAMCDDIRAELSADDR